MKYFKFNNSNSEKHPLFIYAQFTPEGIKDVRGINWSSMDSKNMIPVTQEEFQKVVESYEVNGNMVKDDKVVVLDFCGLKGRYAFIDEIETTTDGLEIYRLSNGATYLKQSIRKEAFIHKT